MTLTALTGEKKIMVMPWTKAVSTRYIDEPISCGAQSRESWRTHTASVSPADRVTRSVYSPSTKSEIIGNFHRIAGMENHKNIAAASVDSASQPRTCQNRVAQRPGQPEGWKMRKSSTSFAISASFWA